MWNVSVNNTLLLKYAMICTALVIPIDLFMDDFFLNGMVHAYEEVLLLWSFIWEALKKQQQHMK